VQSLRDAEIVRGVRDVIARSTCDEAIHLSCLRYQAWIASLALAMTIQKTNRIAPSENGGVRELRATSLRGALATKQSSLLGRGAKYGLLRWRSQ
jgi:hypothetical protein